MIKNDLEKLGFSTEEVGAYIALLELGGGFVSTVARKAGAHRVTTYNTLENLAKKGFAKYTKKKGIKFYYPVNPQVILNQMEDGYRTAKKIVPELLDLQSKHLFKPNIQFFEGLKEIENLFKDMLKSETEIIGYTNYEMANELFPAILISYTKEALKRKKKHRLMCPNDKYNTDYIKTHLKNRIESGILEIFAVNPKQFTFKNAQYIYDDKVATISFDKNEMIGVIIESKNNAETNRSIFNLAWLGATSFVAK
jgi:sugar-specific transcriptional regulator TrmB